MKFKMIKSGVGPLPAQGPNIKGSKGGQGFDWGTIVLSVALSAITAFILNRGMRSLAALMAKKALWKQEPDKKKERAPNLEDYLEES